MKQITALLLFLSFYCNAQVTEDFSDGNFTANPAWNGDISQFIVNSQLQLQLNSSGTDVSYLSSGLTLPTLDSMEWRCFVRQNFSGSTSNNGRIYIVSDQPNLEGPLNGYYILLGEALSNDAIELFRQDGIVSTSVARCTDGAIAGSFSAGIRVTRDAVGMWRIYVDYSGGTNYGFEASGTDATYQSSSYFGVVCSYTSSNATNFYFDDFYSGPIIIDTDPPVISTLTLITSTTADIQFNEQVENITASTPTNYFIDQGIGNVTSATPDATDETIVHLTFPAVSTGIIYTLTVNNVKDLNNNTIASNSTVQFALPDSAVANDIVINEVLFNPFTGGVDFVELYNRSSKAIDLKRLSIANTDDAGQTDDVSIITLTPLIMLPGEYKVLTEEPSDIRSRYASGPLNAFIDMPDLPSYNDDEGGVVLLNGNVEIDRLMYTDDMHFELIDDLNGVSLERLNPDRPSSDPSNWHSASEKSGFATPGLKNSQLSTSVSDGSEVTIHPEIFSPDNDGHEDVLNVHYKFDAPGYTANVKIFNSNGRPVLDLVQNELLGTEEGVWSWDGINSDHVKSPTGIYIIYIEAFNSAGNTKKIKKTCVLGARL